MAKQKSKQFKLEAVSYRLNHEELILQECADNLAILTSALSKWLKEDRETKEIKFRGRGNYSSEEAKEIARLKKELKDSNDALTILRKAMDIMNK